MVCAGEREEVDAVKSVDELGARGGKNVVDTCAGDEGSAIGED